MLKEEWSQSETVHVSKNTEFNLNGINIGTLKYSVKCTLMEPKT